MAWHLKGHGAANVVFGYNGEIPEVRGHVLRIRKPSAHTPSTLDKTIWAGVLKISEGEPTTYELSYMLHIIAPLLGRQYVFPGVRRVGIEVPHPLPHELRPMLGLTAGDPDPPALMQPDHSTFQATGLAGFIGVGPAVCLEIKPKWGLHPEELPPLPGERVPQGSRYAGSSSEQVVCADGQGLGGGKAASAGPMTPDCKGAACMGVDADIRRRYPRFMLHMLYKHVKVRRAPPWQGAYPASLKPAYILPAVPAQSGVPVSTYNPLELFSGDQHRMKNALWRLLQSPSNNLRVFKDGVPVYGANSNLHTVDAGPNETDVVGPLGNDNAPAPGESSLLNLEAKLQGFLAAGTHRNEQWAGDAGCGEGSGTGSSRVAATRALAATAVEVGTAGQGSSGTAACCLETTNGGSKSRPDGLECPSLRAVVTLTALALQQEGVLARLHDIQSLDSLGAEGALRLYDELAAGRGPPGAPLADASASGRVCNSLTCPAHPPGDVTQFSTTVSASCGPVNGDNISSGTPVQEALAERSSMHVATGSPEDSSVADWAPHLAALRGYLMSATAKDCGIMVTMQRAAACEMGTAAGAAPGAAGAQGQSTALAAAELMTPKLMGPGIEFGDEEQRAGAAPVLRSQRPWVGLLREPETDALYLYKIAIVDLDLKMAAKIPTHAKLERALIACAARNPQLLQQLAASAGWVPGR